METVASTNTLFLNSDALFSDEPGALDSSPIIAILDPVELAFELGGWLAGLESFVRSGGGVFGDNNGPADGWVREGRLTHAALLKCAKLNFTLRKATVDAPLAFVTPAELDALALLLRDAVVLNETVLASPKIDFGDWRAWCISLTEKLRSMSVHRKLTDAAEASGQRFLPERLRNAVAQNSVPFPDDVELRYIVTKLGALLGSLKIVSEMLRNDEPLKPSLVIFAYVYEQTNELITHINNRLTRFPNEEAAIFDSLDSASYTASLELKKVYAQELNGLAGVRPVPSVFSRVETASELLSESFRQILTGFGKVLDPSIVPNDLFAEFRTKIEKSLALRRGLWQLMQVVQAAEQDPTKQKLDAAQAELNSFLERTLAFLYHKDVETFERFAEEIFATIGENNIVPILHRFGAYIETLFAQVNMRSVLTGHPFAPPSK